MPLLQLVLLLVTALASNATSGIHTLSATDGRGASAEVRYRLRPSRHTGEADYGPVVGAGTLTIQNARATVVVFSLSALGMTENPTVLVTDLRHGSCGAGAPLSFLRTKRAEYLVVQSVIVGKGCLPQVHLVDLSTSAIVSAIGLDHEFSHRNELPLRYFREIDALRVTDIEKLRIPSYPPSSFSQIVLVQTVDGENRPYEFFIAAVATLPLRGEILSLGLLSGERTLRLSAKQERNWLAGQKPTREDDFAARYNEYFGLSGRLAEQGRFSEALSAYEAALAYLDDPRLFAGENSAVPKLRQLVRDVQWGKISVAQAKRLWFKY